MLLGYKASAEQFDAKRLLQYAVSAERHGFDSVAVSDHFQPWRHSTGHAPFAMTWLGAAAVSSERVLLGTSVLTPTLRYHPAIVAQAFATLNTLAPGRIFLGIGTGEAMNETPALDVDWPAFRERSARLEEAVELIRRLWTAERVTFKGGFYRTRNATIYDRPSPPIPIYVAAGGPRAATMAGRIGDGFICTSGKGDELYTQLLAAVEDGAREAGRDPAALTRMIEVKVSYGRDPVGARHECRWWAALALSGEEKSGIDDPVELERLADAAADRAHTRFIVSDEPGEMVDRIAEYAALGFDHLVFHGPGDDQERFLDEFAADVLPLLRQRFGEHAPAAAR
jgi:coenzyme F420-dependent glucose-6-phosphate dehydrogenase